MTILQVSMFLVRHERARRAMASFSIALFLTGTHFCLVGAVASHFGARVSCMAPGTPAGSCHSAPAASHCAHAAGSGSAPAQPARSATPPCCVALAPVLASTGVKIPIAALAAVVAAPVVTETSAPVLASWVGYRVTRDAGPPALHLRAPLSLRAPPLA